MKHEDYAKAAKDAKLQLAESALTTPYITSEYGNWKHAIKEFELAKRRLAAAEAAWRLRIEPALADPNLRRFAEQRGMIP